jgi:hypothetical protein
LTGRCNIVKLAKMVKEFINHSNAEQLCLHWAEWIRDTINRTVNFTYQVPAKQCQFLILIQRSITCCPDLLMFLQAFHKRCSLPGMNRMW